MSKRSRKLFAGVAVLLLVLLAIPAQATVLSTYTSRVTWESLVSGRTDIDFSILGLAQGGYTNYGAAAGLTTGGVNFTGIDGAGYDLYAYNPPVGDAQNYGSGTILRGPQYTAANYLRITLPTGTTAFGIDLATIAPAAQSFSVVMDGTGLGTVQAAAYPNRVFFGVRTDTPITEVRIYLASGMLYQTQGIFDNVSYGSSSTAPPAETAEATTVLYIGSGLGLLFWTRRRQKLAAL